mgnify:FL=1|tara:strand:+ start:354 stop:989 length:636 start_codon:yes stop_codon:yes gene_type:complete
MKYNKTFKEALEEVRQVKEDGHTDVASAVRQCKTAIEDASQMLSKLQGMNPEDSLPSWWMNKIAIAANSMNKLRDYLLVPSTNEAKEIPPIDKDNAPGVKIAKIRAMDKDGGEDVQALKDKIQKLELELKIEKDKTVKPEPNPETGEVPLRTGLAAALLDKNAKNKPELKGIDTKNKKLKMSLGKSKIEVNPNVEIGVFSGGKNTPTGNLH